MDSKFNHARVTVVFLFFFRNILDCNQRALAYCHAFLPLACTMIVSLALKETVVRINAVFDRLGSNDY